MTVWDYAVLVMAAALVLEGLFKGAVRLAFGLAGLFLGYLYAGYVATRVSAFLVVLPLAARRPVALFAGFFLLFGVCVMAGILLHKLVKHSGLGLLNRLMGGALALCFAVYLTGGFVRLSGRVSPAFRDRLKEAPVVGLFSRLSLGIHALIPDELPLPLPPPKRPLETPPPSRPSLPPGEPA